MESKAPCVQKTTTGSLWRPWEKSTARGTTWTRSCPICDEVFTRRDNLTRHMKSKHEPRSKPSCDHCGRTLSRPDALSRHMRTCQKNPRRARPHSSCGSSSSSYPPSPLDLSQESRNRPSVIVLPPKFRIKYLATFPNQHPSDSSDDSMDVC